MMFLFLLENKKEDGHYKCHYNGHALEATSPGKPVKVTNGFVDKKKSQNQLREVHLHSL